MRKIRKYFRKTLSSFKPIFVILFIHLNCILSFAYNSIISRVTEDLVFCIALHLRIYFIQNNSSFEFLIWEQALNIWVNLLNKRVLDLVHLLLASVVSIIVNSFHALMISRESPNWLMLALIHFHFNISFTKTPELFMKLKEFWAQIKKMIGIWTHFSKDYNKVFHKTFWISSQCLNWNKTFDTIASVWPQLRPRVSHVF